MEVLSQKDFEAALIGNTVTENWDVLVSYSITQLNALLKNSWKQSAKFYNAIFDIPFKPAKLSYHFELQLQPPDISFSAVSGKAQLAIAFSGTWRQDTLAKDKIVVGDVVNTITPGAYRILMSVPIVGVSGEESAEVKEPNHLIQFDPATKASMYITFHFQNKTDTSFKIEKLDPEEHDEDEIIQGLKPQLEGWFGNRTNVNELDLYLAKVTNDTSGAFSNLMEPKSFIFTSQFIDENEGVLNIYIQTVGSNNDVGKKYPVFSPTHTTKSITSIPIGYHASIIISHRVFEQSYLLPQLTNALKTKDFPSPVQAIPTLDGFQFNCTIAQDKTYTMDDKGSWFPGMRGEDIKLNLHDHPIVLNIKDDKNTQSANVTWDWSFNGKFAWSEPSYEHGQRGLNGEIIVNSTLSEPARPLGKIVDSSLAIDLSLSSSSFTTTIKPRDPSWLERTQNMTGSLPSKVRDLKIQFDPINLALAELNYFATQNVLAPGTHMVNMKIVMAPHDVVLLGDLVAPKVSSNIPHGLRLDKTPLPGALSKDKFTRVKCLFDEIYIDENFSGEILRYIVAGNLDAIKSAISSRGYILDPEDYALMESTTIPGPDFDIKFFGGCYKLQADADTGVTELMIHTFDKTIYIDGVKVKDQKIDSQGHVYFSSPDSKAHFDVVFEAGKTGDQGSKPHTLSGQVKVQSNPETSFDVLGAQIFPWDDETPILQNEHLLESNGTAFYDEAGVQYTLMVLALSGGIDSILRAIKLAKKVPEVWDYIRDRCSRSLEAATRRIDNHIRKTFDKDVLKKAPIQRTLQLYSEHELRQYLEKNPEASRNELIGHLSGTALIEFEKSILDQYESVVLDGISQAHQTTLHDHIKDKLMEASKTKFDSTFSTVKFNEYVSAAVDVRLATIAQEKANNDSKHMEARIEQLAKEIKHLKEDPQIMKKRKEDENRETLLKAIGKQRTQKENKEYEELVERIKNDKKQLTDKESERAQEGANKLKKDVEKNDKEKEREKREKERKHAEKEMFKEK